GRLLNSNEISIITKIGFFIFHINEDVVLNYRDHEKRKLISLNYFYYISKQNIQKASEIIKNYDDELIHGWVSYAKDDNERLLKHSNTLLKFAIETNNSGLVDDIRRKCLEINEINYAIFLKHGFKLLKLAIEL